MFCSRFFPDRYFAPRYFPKVGQTPAFNFWWALCNTYLGPVAPQPIK